jgi:hypothetical protein
VIIKTILCKGTQEPPQEPQQRRPNADSVDIKLSTKKVKFLAKKIRWGGYGEV